MPPHPIKLVICDVDGVLTDGRIRIDADGRETKVFHVNDGTAVVLLRLAGIDTALLSGRQSAPVEHRARELKIAQVHLGVHYKAEALDQICAAVGVSVDQAAYIGDDLIDLPVLKRVGFPICPANAHPLCLDTAALVTSSRGGEGVLREAAEFILRAQGKLDAALAAYLSREKSGAES